MSSDSSGPVKDAGLHKQKSISNTKSYNNNSRDDEKQSSPGSKESRQSVKQKSHPRVTVLEQLSFKPTAVDLDVVHRGTATTGTGTHTSTAPTVITAVLRDLCDDIVHSPAGQPGPVTLVNGDSAIAVIGADSVYVQNKSKFIPVPRDKALNTQHNSQTFWSHQTSDRFDNYSPTDVAVLVQRVFTPISSICFGLLGGVALLQLFLVQYLVGGVSEPSDDHSQFLLLYSRFAELTPLLFYVLLAVCIVSVMDRVPVEQEAIVCQPAWLVVTVYCATLLLTLSCAPYDSMLTLYSHNKTMFQDQMRVQELVSEWQLLNTLRCLFALFGWVLFSLTSPPDCLLQHLLQTQQYNQSKQLSKSALTDTDALP